jgi:hypothetical protein
VELCWFGVELDGVPVVEFGWLTVELGWLGVELGWLGMWLGLVWCGVVLSESRVVLH